MEEQNFEIRETSAFVDDAIELIANDIKAVQAEGGIHRLSLCGGGTPRPIYEGLGRRDDIDWKRVLITFGDERCVAPDHSDSNYRMAREAFLDAAGVPEENVVRMPGELGAEAAAQQCEDQLRILAGDDELFVHDLVLLGMGGDGHTASLFPGTSALDESERWVIENHVPQMDTWRISFTYPLINAAKRIVFLVNDPSKRSVLEEVWAGGSGYPSEAVAPANGELTWLVGV